MGTFLPGMPSSFGGIPGGFNQGFPGGFPPQRGGNVYNINNYTNSFNSGSFNSGSYNPNFMGGASPLSALMDPMAANSLSPLGFMNAANTMTSLYTSPLNNMMGMNPMMMGGMNGMMGMNPMMMSGMNPMMMGGMNSMMGMNPMAGMMGGNGFGSFNNMVNPFTLAQFPFGNPYLSPQMQAMQQQMGQQFPQQEQKPNILKILGIVLGGVVLIDLLKKDNGEGGGLDLGGIFKNLLGDLLGGGNNQ